MQQNSISNTIPSNNSGQVSGPQTPSTLGQTFTGTGGGTWTGSSTLSYTQSMQPPDNRNHHNVYCKCNLLFIFKINFDYLLLILLL